MSERISRVNGVKVELDRCDGIELHDMLDGAYKRKAEAEAEIELIKARMGERIGRIATQLAENPEAA